MNKSFCHCLVQRSVPDKSYPVTLPQSRLPCTGADTPAEHVSFASQQRLAGSWILLSFTLLHPHPRDDKVTPVYGSRAGHSSAGQTEQLYRRKWGKTLLICRISWQEFAHWRLKLGTYKFTWVTKAVRCWGFLKAYFSLSRSHDAKGCTI